MKRLAFSVLALMVGFPSWGEEVPPMILARRPASVWRSPTHYRVTYPDCRSETWWRSSNGVHQVNGRIYRTNALGYEGPEGERYRRVGTSWQRVGNNPLTIRRDSTFSYSVGTSRYTVAGNGLYLAAEPFLPAVGTTSTVIRMKNSRPSAFK